MKADKPLLKIENLTKQFFGLKALDQVDVSVHTGELICLIGPNGSGKTTLFNCITGFLPHEKGKIFLRDREITNLLSHQIALAGLTRTFQNVRVFPQLTVLDTLLLAVQQHQEEHFWKRVFRTGTIRELEKKAKNRADELLAFVDLGRLREEPCESLSYGQRKLLSFIFALMPDPDLILLDEPAAAVNPTMINRMKDYIKTLNAQGKTFFIIEHNMGVVMDLAQRIIVLDHGLKIAEGTPLEIKQDEGVIEAYFGR
jgi:ABC-type branched-subunit amino acid transport system ATPase component